MKDQLKKELEEFCKTPTDITEHLVNMFEESIKLNPKLIVELGVRMGDSTKAFVNTAKLTEAELISIDIYDCSKANNWENWKFFLMDSLDKVKINKILNGRKIDVLFIDTDHTLNQTYRELEMYISLMSKPSLIMLHDTNSANKESRVGQAIEMFFGLDKQDWRKDFELEIKGFKIKNYNNNNGMAFIWHS